MEELIEKARAGDQAASKEVFRRAGPTIEEWASRRFKDTGRGLNRPSDIAQNTRARAFQSFSTFEGGSEGELNAWLLRIFENCLIQTHRDARRMKRDEGATTWLDEAKQIASREKSQSQMTSHLEEQSRLVALLSSLPRGQGEAIYLCHLAGHSIAEAAVAMKKTEAAIGGLLQRGLTTLRRKMSEEPDKSSKSRSRKRDTLTKAEVAFLSYVRQSHSGGEVERRAFLAQHSKHADELRAMLDWMDRLRAIWTASSELK